MRNNKIVVLGANGFLGLHLCDLLARKKFNVVALVRDKKSVNFKRLIDRGVRVDFIGNLFKKTKFKNDYSDINCLVNLAALAHIDVKQMKKNKINLYELNNIEENIINNFKNKKLNVIHLSSAKVQEIIKKKNNSPKLVGLYDITKVKSEEIIRNYYQNHVILRPPLVYGPGVKANFLYLMKIIHYNIPLPLNGLNKRRSYIYVENLTDAILHVIKNNHFTGKSYFISDNLTLSTSRLIKILAKYLSKNIRLFYFPKFLLKFIFKILGKKVIYNKVANDFIVENQEFKNDTSWMPPYSCKDGIKKTCFWYKKKFKIS